MITLYTTSLARHELREAYVYIKEQRQIHAIKAVRHGGPSWGLKEAKDLCNAMRDGHAKGIFFVSLQTFDQVNNLVSTRPHAAVKELDDETAGLIPTRHASAIVKHLLDWTPEIPVQVKPWSTEQDIGGEHVRSTSTLTTQRVTPGTPTPERVRPARPRRIPAEPPTATRRLADELKLAWRQAGEPPLRKLQRALINRGVDGAVSSASISKAMSGSTGRPPSWTLVEELLWEFDKNADIDGFWRPLWVQAREEIAPLGLSSTTGTTESSTVVPVINLVTKPEEENNTAASRSDAHDHAPKAGDGDPAGFECEDCGAWVVNADRHYAWHWSMEKQLRRAIIRGVESTGS
ncbi:hypothetical protein GCM10022226_62240 [Sphaerisporangium flaviroseum]|uniref:C2H2-type domain-containing protein n=1 Tax=Sphaerisporangium flaviroseum TaxID=509199 RepID=A0ABP7J1H4_9ACTN